MQDTKWCYSAMLCSGPITQANKFCHIRILFCGTCVECVVDALIIDENTMID